MTRYLAIYQGASREVEKAEVTAEQSAAFLADWARWAQCHAPAIVDNGAPLFRKTRVAPEDDEDFTDTKESRRRRTRMPCGSSETIRTWG